MSAVGELVSCVGQGNEGLQKVNDSEFKRAVRKTGCSVQIQQDSQLVGDRHEDSILQKEEIGRGLDSWQMTQRI